MGTLESRRFFLMALLGLVLFLSWQTWKKEHPDLPPPTATAAVEAPMAAGDAVTASPAPTAATPATAANGTTLDPVAAAIPAPTATTADPAARVTVTTDLLKVSVSLAGGDLRRLELLGYPQAKNRPNQAYALLDDSDPHFHVLQAGLAGTAAPLSTATTDYTAPAASFALAPGAATLEVPLTHRDPATGLTITKLWRFKRASYEVELVQTLANAGTAAVAAAPYARLQRTPPFSGDQPPFSQTFTGVGLYQQKEAGGADYKFVKVALDDLADEPVQTQQQSGWIAMLQHYFLTAIVAPSGQAATFSAKPSTVKGYLAQYVGPLQPVGPAQSASYSTRFYLGPLLHNTLETVAPGLDLTEDYGILTPIAKPMFWLLKLFHGWVANWGVAIILLTLTVKALLYKLSEAQFRSMGKMKKFAPRIADIKERYSGDKERLNKAMMELYTKEGFNPLAGCWPLLVQFPVFLALYWVLSQSVELRQADFGLWLNDLSAPDPYFVLPVLFGLSMWAQQRIQGTAATMDPMQQRMMQFMPVALTAFFAFFPAGLVLYWFVSNLITIAQQWVINRKLAGEDARATAAKERAKSEDRPRGGKGGGKDVVSLAKK